MDADVFVPFVFFGFLAAVILVPIWLKERTKQSAHQLIAQALEKGQQLDPTVMRQLTEGVAKPQQDKARRSLGSGVVLLALAGGFVAAGFVMDGFDPSGAAQNGMMVPAAILGALGLAFILLAIVDYAAKKKDQ
ncbi:MAG: DUF6249 domain-containing protein [Hyphomonadaceae bacterium]